MSPPRLSAERGQMLPLLMFALLLALAVGLAVFEIARASVLRSDAQTAADAAALAGTRNVREQLLRQLSSTGSPSLLAIDDGEVRAAAQDYAGRNDAELLSYERLGVDVRVRVRTVARTGGDSKVIEVDRIGGEARARASMALSAGGVAGGGGTGGGGPVTGSLDVSDKDLADLREELGKPPYGKDKLVDLGRWLQRHGLRVSEHPAFGGITTDAHEHYGSCDHYNGGAIDVNGPTDPAEAVAFDKIAPALERMGWHLLWRVPGHAPGDNSHMHIDTCGQDGGGGVGSPGASPAFPIGGDIVSEIRLVSWEGGPSLLAGLGGGGGNAFGPPDLAIACDISTYAEDHNLSERVTLAGFEAAIVESGVHNLTWGDLDSLGVFQQRPMVGSWGTAAQILDVDHAINAFFQAAQRADRGQPAGDLAQDTQISARPDRYAAVEGQARALMKQMEDGCSGSGKRRA